MTNVCERCERQVSPLDDEFEEHGMCSPCLEDERWAYQESMVF